MSLWSPLGAHCPLTLLWQRRRQAEESQGLQDVRQYWEGRGGNPGAVCSGSPLSRLSLRALPCHFSPILPQGQTLSSSHLCVCVCEGNVSEDFSPRYSLLVSLLNSQFSDGLTRWNLYDLTEAVTCLLCRHERYKTL